MGGAEALLSSMIPQKEMVKTDMYSGVPQSFTEGRNFAKDIFKEKAVSSVQTDDLDRQLMNLRAKKSSLFADVVKDNKARGITMKPSEVRSFVNKFSNEIDNQASTLLTEKKSRIDTAQQLSEADYEVKSKQFLDNRSRQMELDRQIADETVKPQSDPNKITELMKQK